MSPPPSTQYPQSELEMLFLLSKLLEPVQLLKFHPPKLNLSQSPPLLSLPGLLLLSKQLLLSLGVLRPLVDPPSLPVLLVEVSLNHGALELLLISLLQSLHQQESLLLLESLVTYVLGISLEMLHPTDQQFSHSPLVINWMRWLPTQLTIQLQTQPSLPVVLPMFQHTNGKQEPSQSLVQLKLSSASQPSLASSPPCSERVIHLQKFGNAIWIFCRRIERLSLSTPV